MGLFLFFEQKTAYEVATLLEFRRVLFRSWRTVDDRNTRPVLQVFNTWTIDYGSIQQGYILRWYRNKNFRFLRTIYHILKFIGYVESIQFVTSTTSTVFDQ